MLHLTDKVNHSSGQAGTLNQVIVDTLWRRSGDKGAHFDDCFPYPFRSGAAAMVAAGYRTL